MSRFHQKGHMRPNINKMIRKAKLLQPYGKRFHKEVALLLERYTGCWAIAAYYLFACSTNGIIKSIDVVPHGVLDGGFYCTAEKNCMWETNDVQEHSKGVCVCEWVSVRCFQWETIGEALFSRLEKAKNTDVKRSKRSQLYKQSGVVRSLWGPVN